MPDPKPFMRADVTQLQAALTKLADSGPPQRKTMTKQQVVARLKEPIERLQKQGYRLAEIAERLGQDGFSISVAVLRVYLKQGQGRQRRPKRPPREQAQQSEPQKPASPAPAVAAQENPEAR